MGLILPALLFTSCVPILTAQPDAPQRVTFADFGVEKAVREIIKKPEGVILASELEKVYNLNLFKPAFLPKIKDVSGLEYCINLKWLDLSNHEIEDISPLAPLHNLRYLDLGHNSISDISPLASLTNLSELHLEDNNITDLTGLESNTGLISLDLSRNNISDVSALSSLTNLSSLKLGYNAISDISPLASMERLSDLRLTDNKVVDISLLSSLVSLQTLYLTKNGVTDVSPLSALPDLTSLWLGDNMIDTISPLSSSTHLDFLLLDGNPLDEASRDTIIPSLTASGVDVLYISKPDFQEILRLLFTIDRYDDYYGHYNVIDPVMSAFDNRPIDTVTIQCFQDEGYDITDLAEILYNRNMEPIMMDIESSPQDGYIVDYDAYYISYLRPFRTIEGWEALRQENPDFGCFVKISVPAYDPQTNLVLVYLDWTSLPFTGVGSLVLYEYTEGRLIELYSWTRWVY